MKKQKTNKAYRMGTVELMIDNYNKSSIKELLNSSTKSFRKYLNMNIIALNYMAMQGKEDLLEELKNTIKNYNSEIYTILENNITSLEDKKKATIAIVQASLIILGYKSWEKDKQGNHKNIKIDGIFGSRTFFALLQFQNKSNVYKELGGDSEGVTNFQTIIALTQEIQKL